MTDRAYERHAFVCTLGPWCPKDGPAEAVQRALKRAVKEAGRASEIRVNQSGCLNQCGHGPMLVVYPEAVWYGGLDEERAARVAAEHLLGGAPVEDLRYRPARPGANKTDRVRAAEAEGKGR